MIAKKDFYFIRHGQTDHNLVTGPDKGDHPHLIPLNAKGREQAHTVTPLIASLKFDTIFCSPTARTIETKEIISKNLSCPHYIIDTLTECPISVWREMFRYGMYSPAPQTGDAHRFMQTVRQGVNQVLSHSGTPLIVAHGGIHWAICALLGIENYEWIITNCGVVHFSVAGGKWVALKLG